MRSPHIVSSLRDAFRPPEWAIMFEVSEGTGALGGRRRADAIAMNMWPSRGMEIMGLEIKVSRQDLMSELNNPKKAEEIARYCDTWYLVTPVDLVTEEDKLPLTWGLMEVDERGRVKTRVKPTWNKSAEPMTKTFMASCLRGAANIDQSEIAARMKTERERMRDDYDRDVEREAQRIAKSNKGLQELRETVIEIVGDQGLWMLKDSTFVEALRAVYNSGVAKSWKGLADVEEKLRVLSGELAESADGVLAQIKDMNLTPRTRTRRKK